ncbi:REP-associated tyrosine transposase [Hymenobacter armeniacus]|uniref:Transposase n=1 Tax=Hymenobacter armeniacus TaxID=2771358 RepID=A0ABR8K122_9BACT|nr:transposase [Hymenobacter armeniacus]MBD2723954.1 transposase [Hymenobacter armeniacus]
MELTHYQRFLPHTLGVGESYFITFRLAGSLPREVVLRLMEERELLQRQNTDIPADNQPRKGFFSTFDAVLDRSGHGPCYLCGTAEAAIVKDSLHYADGPSYHLLAYCVMPNHVHLVVHLPLEAVTPLARTLQRLKSHTARHLNRLWNDTGRVWQRESYDHRIRNARELTATIAYTLNNPVKAGLVTDWQQWPHNYWREE